MKRPDFIKNLSMIKDEEHYLDPNPDKYRTRKRLGKATGAKLIGVNQSTLKPGQVSSEFHRHENEEEFLLILSGRAILRYGKEEYEVESGDAISLRPSGEAHQLVNRFNETCLYLEIGTRHPEEAIEYPEIGIRRRGGTVEPIL